MYKWTVRDANMNYNAYLFGYNKKLIPEATTRTLGITTKWLEHSMKIVTVILWFSFSNCSIYRALNPYLMKLSLRVL